MIDKNRAKRYCSEDISLIEGYDKAVTDKDGIWDLHHRAEILPCGNYSRDILKKYNLYDHRPAAELIFLPHDEHARLHHVSEKNPFFGKRHSEASRKKMSAALSGENSPSFGKPRSEETRKRIAAALRGRHPSEESLKKMSAAQRGKRLSEEHKKKLSQALSGKHRSDETRKKMSQSLLGTHYWNNGVKTVRAKTCPPGFVKGRIYHRRAAQERGRRPRQ